MTLEKRKRRMSKELPSTVVEFKNVTFRYEEEAYAVKDVSFSIKEGEYCCLIGHNGSGKSTIAKLIIGILVQEEGEIYLFNEELTDDSLDKLRKPFGIVFQNPDNQFIGNIVRDDIAFGLENDCFPEDKMEEQVDKYAELVGMKDYLDKEPSNLSGGQKQRVAIAGALARNPKVLILDEATSMLDPKGKREIMELIFETKKNNPDLTIISITHDIQEAYQADRVIVLDSSKLVMDDTPLNVFSNREKLLSMHLDIPFYLELSNKLMKRKLIDKPVNSLKELEEKICE